MRSYLDCMHCFLKQSISCMTIAGTDEETQYDILCRMMDYVKEFNREDSPATNSSKTLLKTYEWIGKEDPYKQAKLQSNDLALELYPRLKDIVSAAGDRLYEALKISVTGNIIDLGIHRSYNIEEALKHSLETGFSRDDFKSFKEKLDHTSEVLFLGDNSGEIVFDRVLVEELVAMGKKVTYAVKESPILNDATIEDAIYTGMDKAAKVITNGSGYLGTYLKNVSPNFLEQLYNAQLIIAKGHANFEELEDEDFAKGKVFFLLKIKCDCVAKVAVAKLGDVVFITR